ncbi:MAG: acetyl-CoA carboxylase biotin carboxyl carrier protein [Lachnospiraceae bacterium]|nr:acetyl-CoA carboxylase biotin carboxyl carrier protein [Lachnospiraceae bacterium]
MTVQEIKELIGAFSGSEAVEMELEQSDIKLVLKKEQGIVSEPVMIMGHAADAAESIAKTDMAPAAETVAAPAAVSEAAPTASADLTQIKAPLAGIFYRSASPEAAPYVMAGQEVKKGDVIGLIEAMKVMNEIPAPCDGVIENILAENEAFVGYDEVLMELS